jgi:hypothetical protein
MWTSHPALTALTVLVLACAGARAQDPQSEPPDPKFLEFLGSVDRLSEVNPNYLAQAEAAQAKRPAATGTPPPSSPPPPPPPEPPPPNTGAKNND